MAISTQNPEDARPLYNAAGLSRVVFSDAQEAKAKAEGYTLQYKDLPARLREYPKALYMGGDRNSTYIAVADEAEESAARADGYKQIDAKADAVSVAKLKAAEPESPVTEKKPKK